MTADDRGASELRQKVVADLKNLERRKGFAMRGSGQATASGRFARRRVLALGLLGGMAGLAMVGALGGVIGDILLGHVVRASGAYAVAFQAAAGSVIVAGAVFAILGALGHVMFADVVGDFRAERGEPSGSPGDWFADTAIEFTGGGTWGVLCGMLIGVLGAALERVLPVVGATPILAGAAGGAVLGLFLTILAGGFRYFRHAGEVGERRAANGAPPWSAYFHSAKAACEQFLRRS